jgi:hypothetical protein
MTIDLHLYLRVEIKDNDLVISLMRSHDQGDFVEASASISRNDLLAFLKEPGLVMRPSATAKEG